MLPVRATLVSPCPPARRSAMKPLALALPLLLVLTLNAPAPAAAKAKQKSKSDAEPAWVRPMRQVHARFTGKAGSFALFGDSITVSLAFWAPLRHDRKNMSAEAQK